MLCVRLVAEARGKQVVAGSGEDERGALPPWPAARSPWQTPGLKAGHRQNICHWYASPGRQSVGQLARALNAHGGTGPARQPVGAPISVCALLPARGHHA